MGNQMKGLLYYFTTQAKRSLYIFWSILGVSLLVSFIIAMILDRTQVGEAEFFFLLSFAVYVFSAFYGFISYATNYHSRLKWAQLVNIFGLVVSSFSSV